MAGQVRAQLCLDPQIPDPRASHAVTYLLYWVSDPPN